MIEVQHHVIRTKILLQKACMMVRFPCSLTFEVSFKHQSKQNKVSSSNCQLISGECLLNQELSLETDLIYEENYPDVQLIITVQMHSSNGRIIAGKCYLKLQIPKNLAQVEEDQKETGILRQIPIQKCSDKTAIMTLTYQTEFIKSYKKEVEIATPGFPLRTHTKFSQISDFMFSGKNFEEKKKDSKNYSKIINNKQKNNSSGIKLRTSDLQQQYEKQKWRIPHSPIVNLQGSRGREEDNFKVLKRQKQAYRRQIIQLNSQLLQSKRDQQMKLYGSKIARYEIENEKLLEEATKYKQKQRNMERKERDLLHNIKTLKQQVQKYTSKQSENENINTKTALQYKQKDNRIRRLQTQLKSLKDQVDELKVNSNIQEKKLELKQLSYNQQIKKLTDKCGESEKQRDRAVHEFNAMLGEFELTQKKNQSETKEKGIARMEERNKLLKKIDQLTKSNQITGQQNFELKNKKSELELTLKFTTQSKKQLNSELENARAKIQQQNQLLKKLNTVKHQYEMELSQLKGYKTEHSTLTTKYLELKEEHKRISQKYNHTSSILVSIQKKHKQTSEQLVEHQKQRQRQNYEIKTLKQVLKQKQNQIKAYEEESQSLKVTKEQLTSKIGEMKHDSDEYRLQHHSILNKLESQLVYIKKLKEHDSTEIDQLKQRIQKSQEASNSKSKKIIQLNEKIIGLNENILKKDEKYQESDKECKRRENQISLLKNNINSFQTKEKQIQKEIKTKIQIQFELKKTLKEKEKEIFILKQKYQQKQSQVTDLTLQLNHLIIQKKDQLAKITQINHDLNIEIKQLKINQQNRQKLLSKLTQRNKDYVNTCETNKQSIQVLESQNQKLTEKLQISQQASKALKSKIQNLVQKFNIKSSEYDKLLSQREKQKLQNRKVMQFLSDFLSRKSFQKSIKKGCNVQPEEEGEKIQIVNEQEEQRQVKLIINAVMFSDEYLASIEQKIMKNYTQHIIKSEEESAITKRTFEYRITQVQNQISRVRNQKEELEESLKSEKQLFKSATSDFLSQKQQLEQNIMQMDEQRHNLKADKDKLQRSIEHIRDQLSALQTKNTILEDNNRQIQRQNQILSIDIEKLQKQNMSSKKYSDTELTKVLGENKVKVQKYRQNIKQLQKKIQISEQKNNQYKQLNEKMNEDNKNMRYKIQKAENLVRQKNIKCQEILIEKQKIQEVLEKSNSRIYKLEELLNNQNVKVSEFSKKIDEMSLRVNEKLKVIQDLQSAIKKKDLQITEQHRQYMLQKQILQNFTIQRNEKQKQLMERFKQLQNNIMTQNTQLQLKSYQISQLEAGISNIKKEKQQLEKQLNLKNQQIKRFEVQQEQMKNQLVFVHQNCQSLQHEKNVLEIQNLSQKEHISELTMESAEKEEIIELLETKQLELQRFQEAYSNLQMSLSNNIEKNNHQISVLKKDLGSKFQKQEELKFIINQLQEELTIQQQQSQIELSEKLQFITKQRAYERQQNRSKISHLEDDKKQLKSELQMLHQQLQIQIDEYKEQCQELRNLLDEKEDILIDLQESLVQKDHRIKVLSGQLKNCLEAWDNQKQELMGRRLATYKNEIEGFDKFQGSFHFNQSDNSSIHNNESKNFENGQDYDQVLEELNTRGKKMLQKYKNAQNNHNFIQFLHEEEQQQEFWSSSYQKQGYFEEDSQKDTPGSNSNQIVNQ